MTALLAAICLLAGGGVLALFAMHSPRAATILGAGSCVLAALAGLVPVLRALGGAPSEAVRRAWDVPYGSFHVELDALSAVFVLPILVLCALSAVAGTPYWLALAGWPGLTEEAPARVAGASSVSPGHPQPGAAPTGRKTLGPVWFFFNTLAASMILVVVARNGVLFLVAWEVMSLAAYFLIMVEDEKPAVQRAGWTFLVAAHLGTTFLLVLFVLLGTGREAPFSLEFDHFSSLLSGRAVPSGVLLLLALVGFGTKAGFMPLHVWLPETYPAVPGHVAAVLSGVMSKTGIYGLLRTLTFLEGPPAWWAWLLIGVGLTSGVLGILAAQAQRDLRRLLAYSSIENMGIIALGLGTGLLGLSLPSPALALLGFTGALLHVLNHSLFKGLLFLASGAVLHGTGTTDLEKLGGVLKRMPWTGAAFAVGAVAICGLPPLNGFASEFLIYLAAFHEEMKLSLAGGAGGGRLAAIPPLAVIAGLALIGGLAAACFTKAFGIAFLGTPRSQQAEQVRSTEIMTRAPMLLLAGGCFAVGLGAPWLLHFLLPAVSVVVHAKIQLRESDLAEATSPLGHVVLVSALMLVLIASLTYLRYRLLLGRPVTKSETWGCGYARPTARMQYTASSYTQQLDELFQPVLRIRTVEKPILTDYFPAEEGLVTETPELCRERFYQPLFVAFQRLSFRLRWLQQGRVQVYILYIALTIFILLIWYLGFAA